MTVPSRLPTIFEAPHKALVGADDAERSLVGRAAELFKLGYYDHALVDIWNAAINNLRRKVEAYSVDLWISVVKDEPGRKRYNKDGETLAERWSGIDDLVLIAGATKLSVLNKKAGKSLEMINWMRNHASAAHLSDHKVEQEDVVALAMMIERNLLADPMPEQAHSITDLFEPVKRSALDLDQVALLSEQIRSLRVSDMRVCFGFMLDLLCEGVEPAASNAKSLFPVAWERANDDLRRTVGMRYHQIVADPAVDESPDKGARARLLDFLTVVGGIQYVPDGVRASLYRIAARKLAEAKDSSYGWAKEEEAAQTLVQFGFAVPSAAFEEVYQEIVAVWCGNYWGRSTAFVALQPFVEGLSTDKLLTLARLFRHNERVKAELFQPKPQTHAIALLTHIKSKMPLAAHQSEVDSIIAEVQQL